MTPYHGFHQTQQSPWYAHGLSRRVRVSKSLIPDAWRVLERLTEYERISLLISRFQVRVLGGSLPDIHTRIERVCFLSPGLQQDYSYYSSKDILFRKDSPNVRVTKLNGRR